MKFKNKNIFVLIAALYLFSSFSIFANEKEGEFRKIDNRAFTVGERLTFEVKYGFVTAGIAVMAIPNQRRLSGRDVYQVTFEVNTVPSFDWFFKVRDRYETYLDIEGIFPWRFEQHIREGNFSYDYSAFFDQRRGIAKTAKGEFEIPRYTNDIMSAFYFARTIDYSEMKPGDKIKMQNFHKDKVHDLDVVYHGKETISVEAGTFDCLIVEPLVREGGLFKSEGTIMIWLTDDEVKMPVRVKTKVVIGSIDSDLISYEGIKGKLTSRRK